MSTPTCYGCPPLFSHPRLKSPSSLIRRPDEALFAGAGYLKINTHTVVITDTTDSQNDGFSTLLPLADD